MQPSDLITMFGYNAWATSKILQAAARLDADQFAVAPPGHTADLRSLLTHVVGVERLWRARLETGMSPAPFPPDEFPTVAALARRWDEEHQAMRDYLATLDASALNEPIRFRRRGDELSPPLIRWHLLMQCITHGVQHRGEAAMLLTALGHSPGDLDFFFYVLEQAPAG
jgi:uncharacterized damage-inducible protein DinB